MMMVNEGLWCILLTKRGKWFKNNGFIGWIKFKYEENGSQHSPKPEGLMSSCKQELVHIGRLMYSDVIKVNNNKTFQ
jgi:hypothetical protein